MVYFVEAKQPTTVTSSLLSLIFAQNYKNHTESQKPTNQNNKPSEKNMRDIFQLLLERAGHVRALQLADQPHLVITLHITPPAAGPNVLCLMIAGLWEIFRLE